MADVILQLSGLVKRFGHLEVLKEISAEVRAGDVVGLLGLNGSGKTTLIETALGFAIPDAGSVRVLGQHASALQDEKLKHRIGLVPQQDDLIDVMSGRTFLNLISTFYPRWNHDLVARLVREWSIPLEPRVSTLSVGQRQKLSILAAIGHEPEFLVLDEPVSSLDPLSRRKFLQELVSMAATGNRTMLFSTHLVGDLERIANRAWILKEGRLIVDQSTDEIKESGAMIASAAAAGSAGLIAGTAGMSLEDIFLELHR